MNTEYSRPSECGKRSSCVRSSWLAPPCPQSAVARPQVAVVHSPTPSTVSTAASSNGEAKKALAAWERWWSTNNTRSAGVPRCFWICALIQTFSLSQT